MAESGMGFGGICLHWVCAIGSRLPLCPRHRVTIPLRRPRDSSIYLSPDGRWVITGYHNQHGLDLYDNRAGKFIRTFAEEGLAGPVFGPHTGALFTVTATNYTKWNLTTG